MTDVKYDADKLAREAQDVLNKFKTNMKKIADEALSEIYVQIIPYIETDTWTNYREALRIDLEHEYTYHKFKEPWAKNLRRAIFVENRDELARLLNQDLLERIKALEDQKKEYDMFRYSL